MPRFAAVSELFAHRHVTFSRKSSQSQWANARCTAASGTPSYVLCKAPNSSSRSLTFCLLLDTASSNAPIEVRQGDTLSMLSSITRDDVASATVNSLALLREGMKPSTGTGWTFELGKTSRIPSGYSGDILDGSLYATNSGDTPSWRNIFGKLRTN